VKHTNRDLLFGLSFFIIALVLVHLLMAGGRADKQYAACEVAEISPDFTPAMRETCRQLRSKRAGRLEQ